MKKALKPIIFLIIIAGFYSFYPAAYAAVSYSFDNDLVAYWPLDQDTNDTIHSASGSLKGTAGFSPGKFSNAISLDGSAGYISVPVTTALSGLTTFTISAWVNVANLKPGNLEVIERGSSYHMGGTFSLYYSDDYNRFVFDFYDAGTHYMHVISPVVFSLATWHHVTVVADGSKVVVYADGMPGIPMGVPNGMYPLENGRGDQDIYKGTYIGALVDETPTPTNFFNGSIDDIRIYNRALTDSEVLTLWGSSVSSYTTDFPISLGTTPWPHLFGKVGGYGIVGSQDVVDIAHNGFNLFLGGGYNNPSSSIGQAMIANNVDEIINLTSRLYQICPPNPPSGQCIVSPTDEQSILDYAQSLLDQSSQDPHVVGYWILDDTPGDVHQIIQEIHDLVANANKTAIFPRPAICGLAGDLDYKADSSQQYFTAGDIAANTLVNISGTDCDAIAPYLYGAASQNDPTLVDWSMQNFLPQVYAGLRSRGWDQSKQPIIALPHAFDLLLSSGSYYVLPTAADVEEQSLAYCKAGAIALLPYAWHTGPTGSNHSLWNTPTLVTGLQQGMQECQNQYWSASPTPTPTPSPTPTSTPTPTPASSGGGGGGGGGTTVLYFTPTPTPTFLLSTTTLLNLLASTTATSTTTGSSTEGQLITYLKAQIAYLIKTINALLAGRTAKTPASPLTPKPLTRQLWKGLHGEDVKTLQIILNSNGYIIASSGPGSLGQETTFFGDSTKEAVARFQADHGIHAGGGVGELTMEALNELIR